MVTEEIQDVALKLNALDRMHLAEIILDSLDMPDNKIEKLWISESEKRYQAYKAGRVKGIPLEEFRLRIENECNFSSTV